MLVIQYILLNLILINVIFAFKKQTIREKKESVNYACGDLITYFLYLFVQQICVKHFLGHSVCPKCSVPTLNQRRACKVIIVL